MHCRVDIWAEIQAVRKRPPQEDAGKEHSTGGKQQAPLLLRDWKKAVGIQ